MGRDHPQSDDSCFQPLAVAAAVGRTLHYLGRIYGCIQEGGTAKISEDVERVTGHPPRTFAAFVEENKAAWRRAG